jgi:hypothetical protein
MTGKILSEKGSVVVWIETGQICSLRKRLQTLIKFIAKPLELNKYGQKQES